MGSLLDNVRKSLFGDPALQPTDVTGELVGAGTAFAALIEGVGTAVAKAQAGFDATSGHIATEMAKTQVDTVQAVVTDYDDNGNIVDVTVVSGKTSALAIAVPPGLSFNRVHIEGSFLATEFSATQHQNVNINLAGFSVAGKGFRGLSAGGSVVNANTDVQTAVTQDSSVATMSMTALITPKPVTAIPKPPLVLKGPVLALSFFQYLPLTTINPPPVGPNDPPALYQRSAVVQIQLFAAANSTTVLPSKTIAVDCGGLDSVITGQTGIAVSTGPITDSNGIFYITVSRTIPSPTEAKTDFVLRAALNLVNTTLSVSL